MNTPETDTDQLLRRAQRGDERATGQLLLKHRDRLRQMLAYNLDRRLAGRIDPSDVVQETLAEAARKLPEYARSQPIPFYPWLRSIARDRLANLHNYHLAQKRSVQREQQQDWIPSYQSVARLADRLVGSGTSPSQHMQRKETRKRVAEVLARLSSNDREVLVLRYLEQLSIAEAVAVLGISEQAFMKRHMRAIQRFRLRLEEP